MKNWKTSLYVQIIYMAGMGLGLSLTPQLVADLLPIGTVSEIWVRIVGILALVLCIYYYSAIRQDSVWFARASWKGRYFFCSGLALAGYVYDLPLVIGLAVLEALLATWTFWSLR